MRIEIGHVPKGLEVPDAAVRTVTIDGEEAGPREAVHFQARIHNRTGRRFPALRCELAYYADAHRFLGLDKFDTGSDDEDVPAECSLSMPVRVPEDAESAILTIHRRRSARFFGWAGRIITVLFILLLVAWVIRAFRL